MSRPKRQKIERESLAAYSASQPLFDTLRTASSKLVEQEAHLTNALNVVQMLHVKIANNDDHFSLDRHHNYMDAAVKAWHTATETYCAIFEQLVTITAADPTEGREKGQRHEEFVTLLETARKAEETVKKFDTAKDTTSADSEEDEEEDDEVPEPAAHTNGTGKRPMAGSTNEKAEKTAKSKSSTPNKDQTPNPLKLSALSEDIRYDKSGTKILWQDGKLKVPVNTLTPEEQRAWKVIKERQRRKGRLSRLKRGLQGTAQAAPMETQEPEGAYEDVSAEVEARLKAKRDKKAAEKAKRTEKKRKRESGDSYTAAVDSGFTAAGGEVDEEPVKEITTGKPAKKRVRKNQEVDEETPKAAPTSHAKSKRKSQDLEDETSKAAPASAGKSKRKKSLEGEAQAKNSETAGEASKKRKKTSAWF